MFVMPRNPYDAHLCERDPEAWERGFFSGANFANEHPGTVVTLAYDLVRQSDGGLDWSRAPVPYTAWGEGWMLGVYGAVALQKLEVGT